jgi:hypothetical protein
MIVPEPGHTHARVRRLDDSGSFAMSDAEWTPTAEGFEVRVRLRIPHDGQMWLNVLVNETAPGRARRRGQLVLAGANGEFVYLRGDRNDPDRMVHISVTT